MTSKSFVATLSLSLLISVFLILSSNSFLHAQVQRLASVVESKGKVEFLRAKQTDWNAARKGTVLKTGDSVRTAKDASAVLAVEGVGEPSMIKVAGGTTLKLSDLALDEKTGAQNTLLDMAIGDVLVSTKPKSGSQFQVKTPTSIIGARGTAFRVKEYQS
ncbi:MAG: FecR domain-containing protein [Candidatus Omnitrophica bacterium]|nr:FecR domain-containing protein [Candidatus Omnitrophota bacterium]